MALPKSLRVRYTLRAVFVFVTLFCLWAGFHANRGWRERQAVAVLERHGGVVGPRGIYEGFPLLIQASANYRRVVQSLWREPFIRAVGISSALEPDVVEAIATLPHLESLTLAAPDCGPLYGPHARPVDCPPCRMPAGALQRLLSGHQVTYLDLDHWILSDEDVEAIANHTPLAHLTLDSVTLPDNGLAGLVAMPRLQWFVLRRCQVDDGGLADAPVSATLTTIQCVDSTVGPGFGAYIGRLPRIESLGLVGPTIDDAFIAGLGPHPSLQFVGVEGPGITGQSLSIFEDMPALKMVGLPSHLHGHPAVWSLQGARRDLKVQTYSDYIPSLRRR
jgi:hypothetical protein